jgi:hypothetical protein
MQTRYVLFAVIVVLIFGLMSWLRSRSGSSSASTATPQQISQTDLSAGEQHIYTLLREVQGHAILTESFVREAADAKVSLTLDTNKTTVSSLTINLSSLARKQKDDGLSDGAIRKGFVF